MPNNLPKFEVVNFQFEEDVPEHIEAMASLPFNPDLIALTAGPVRAPDERIALAVDIPDWPTAQALISARLYRQESVIKAYGHTEDIYVTLFSKNAEWMVYDGWRMSGDGSCLSCFGQQGANITNPPFIERI